MIQRRMEMGRYVQDQRQKEEDDRRFAFATYYASITGRPPNHHRTCRTSQECQGRPLGPVSSRRLCHVRRRAAAADRQQQQATAGSGPGRKWRRRRNGRGTKGQFVVLDQKDQGRGPTNRRLDGPAARYRNGL